MSIDVGIVVAGAVVGFVVGLTGMGGGALMTPMLVLLFGVDPLTAVSTDLVAAVVIKPIGATGQSVGMKVMGLRCIDANTGRAIGAGRSFGRYLFAAFVSGNVCFSLGYLWALFDD